MRVFSGSSTQKAAPGEEQSRPEVLSSSRDNLRDAVSVPLRQVHTAH